MKRSVPTFVRQRDGLTVGHLWYLLLVIIKVKIIVDEVKVQGFCN